MGIDYDRIVKRTGDAIQQVGRVLTDDKMDPDLKFYDTMTADDFEAMSTKYGNEATTKYIREMESRRMGVE
jgi:hypothetical protein